MFDLGFFGVEADYRKQRSSLHIKKEKGCNLTAEQKKSTTEVILKEGYSGGGGTYKICRIKKYRIINDVFRNRLRKYDRISSIVSGLVNYRIMNIYSLHNGR